MRWLASVVLVFAALAACVVSSMRGNVMRSSRGDYYYWDSHQFPLTIDVNADVTDELGDSLPDAIYKWNHSVGRQVFILNYGYTTTQTYVDPFRPDLGHVALSMGELGFSTSSGNRRKVSGRTINHLFFDRFGDNDGRLRAASIWVDIDAAVPMYSYIVAHELGHALGLGHDNENKDSIMYPTVQYGNVTAEDAALVREMMDR